MICYVSLSVKFNGLLEDTCNPYLISIDSLLRANLDLKSDSDLDVEVVGHLQKEGKVTLIDFGIQVHGLNDDTSEIIRRRVEDLLVAEFKPIHRLLIHVTVIEFAGTPER